MTKTVFKRKIIPSDTSNHLYEIDFLISTGDKISLIEVKAGNYREHKSLNVFCDKYNSLIKDKYVVHANYKNGRILYIIFQYIWCHFYKICYL